MCAATFLRESTLLSSHRPMISPLPLSRPRKNVVRWLVAADTSSQPTVGPTVGPTLPTNGG